MMHSYTGGIEVVAQRPAARLKKMLTLYSSVRRASEELCAPLAVEDYGLQAMPETSPLKWHLAHTTWFFETFILKPYKSHYVVFHPRFEYLFNSYYDAVGPQFPRAQRGLLSRPSVDEVYRYRAYVDAAIIELIESATATDLPQIISRLTLGCNHEEQHQELMLTDIKYNLSVNPLRPAYREDLPIPNGASALSWIKYPGGLQSIGHQGDNFAFDNELPRHRVYVAPYALGSRLVTNGEYLEFIEAGGYAQPQYWLADGWRVVQSMAWQAPLYWERIDGGKKSDDRWSQFTLAGLRPLNEHEPVCHLSVYEADAYARFRNKRLPTEAEWELAAAELLLDGNFRESGLLHPRPAADAQFFGDVWEWTSSSYAPYPGYRSAHGALGEYNGKFMANQMVLRGGSCVTPARHIRATYRNFFYPPDRWQFSGVRLAEDV